MAETEEKITTAETTPDATAVLPEPALQPTREPPIAPAKPVKRSGGFALLLGGVLAAGAGYGLAQFVPNGWPIADTSALQATIDAQAKDIATLKDQIAQLPAPTVDLAPLGDAMAQLDTRVSALETAGPTIAPTDLTPLSEAVAKLQADLAALQASGPIPANVTALAAEAEARLKEAEAQAAQMKAEAEALTKAATARAALGRLQNALDTGAPYAAILGDLGQDVPDALAAHAETGLPSPAMLQDSFPAAARAALEAAIRADMGETWTDRATNFLRSQTGARSLTPQEGNDPDAILSRAEAALAAGNLDQTLTELSALPEAAQAALAEWRGLAEQRQAGLQALADVASKIKG